MDFAMKKIISNIRYSTHLLLMGLVFCLFLSTTLAADRVCAMKEVETGAIEMDGARGVADVSMVKNSLCTGENLFPWFWRKRGRKPPARMRLN